MSSQKPISLLLLSLLSFACFANETNSIKTNSIKTKAIKASSIQAAPNSTTATSGSESNLNSDLNSEPSSESATKMVPNTATSNTTKLGGQFASNKPITIDADNQQIDLEKNTVTFSGKVVIVQDGLTIKADKVVITDMQDNSKQKINAYGKPLQFNQVMPEKNRTISGHSDQLVYNVKQNLVTLTGNAEIIQQDSHIASSVITYDVDKQQIVAQPGKNERVKTTIIPNQFKKGK